MNVESKSSHFLIHSSCSKYLCARIPCLVLTNHLVKAGGSFFAAGTWCPGKNELQTIRLATAVFCQLWKLIRLIRNHILRSSRRLRETISKPEFVKLYGEPKKGAKGQRSNIFGFEDELKVAPKGIDKNHKYCVSSSKLSPQH